MLNIIILINQSIIHINLDNGRPVLGAMLLNRALQRSLLLRTPTLPHAFLPVRRSRPGSDGGSNSSSSGGGAGGGGGGGGSARQPTRAAIRGGRRGSDRGALSFAHARFHRAEASAPEKKKS
jgi:hypothetical protein